MQRAMTEHILLGLDHATREGCADYLNFSEGHQTIVDAAFLAHGLLRAWDKVWLRLDGRVQGQIVRCMKLTRSRAPYFNNWLLFSSMIEAFLCKAGEDWDPMRVDYALRQHEQWYLGDGNYGDGPEFHCDYYNSFVIYPMLIDLLNSTETIAAQWVQFKEPVERRFRRYAQIQARFIMPDGYFPPIGRSITYRFGAFQALAQAALQDKLPDDLSPAAVRCALTAVIRRIMQSNNNFDDEGWLRIGLVGHQPSLGEIYISTGSLYLCLCGCLPLGLSPDAAFWNDPDEDWITEKIWKGYDMPPDHAQK